MESRRLSRTVVDPKVRQVGFFTSEELVTAKFQSIPADTAAAGGGGRPFSPPTELSLAGSSISPVMIPSQRYASADGLHSSSRAAGAAATVSVHAPPSPLRGDGFQMLLGSYNPHGSLHGVSAVLSPSCSRSNGSEFLEEAAMPAWLGRTRSGKAAASFPASSGEIMMAVKNCKNALKTTSEVKTPPGVTDSPNQCTGHRPRIWMRGLYLCRLNTVKSAVVCLSGFMKTNFSFSCTSRLLALV